eukprot:SAG11_NODE_4234_length_1996_cov_3.429117_3_plen_134_part_00
MAATLRSTPLTSGWHARTTQAAHCLSKPLCHIKSRLATCEPPAEQTAPAARRFYEHVEKATLMIQVSTVYYSYTVLFCGTVFSLSPAVQLMLVYLCAMAIAEFFHRARRLSTAVRLHCGELAPPAVRGWAAGY